MRKKLPHRRNRRKQGGNVVIAEFVKILLNIGENDFWPRDI